MATPELDLMRLDAGRAYFDALRVLGFIPEALFWAFDSVEERFVLVLVTEFYDFKGPLALSKLLFAAYLRAGTPPEIDPFVIRMHSPNHTIVPSLVGRASGGFIERVDPQTRQPDGVRTPFTGGTIGSLHVDVRWGYKFGPKLKHDAGRVMNRWARVSRNVDRLAA